MLTTIKFLHVKTTGGFNFLLHLIIHILPIFYNEPFFFNEKKAAFLKIAWYACLFSRVTKKGVAREMQLSWALLWPARPPDPRLNEPGSQVPCDVGSGEG